jgi:hypothetical protein
MILAMILALTTGAAGGAPVFYSYAQGMRWEFVVREADLDGSPRWQPSAENPPLSPRAAIQSGRSLLRKFIERADDWELRSVALQPVPGRSDFWLYLVEFWEPIRPKASVGSVHPSQVRVVVLMNGTAVTPTLRPVEKR